MTELIRRFGLLGVFLLMVPESACIPVPSEVTLLFSGFGVGEHWMSLPLAIAAATAGNLIGSLLAYAVGASGVTTRLPGGAALLRRTGGLLDEHALRMVFLARLLPLARTFVSLPAGARRVPLAPFVVLTTIGCALWAALFVTLGLLCGAAWAAVGSILGKALLAIGAVTLAVVFLRKDDRYALGTRRREGEMADDDKRHPSRSADAAAARWAESHPDEDPEQQPPPHVPEDEDVVPNRHSASAEAASLRWHEEHSDEESD